MRLADEITITIGGEAFELRPTLRAAITLERRQGLATLFPEIIAGHLGRTVDLIAATSVQPVAPDAVAAALARAPLGVGINAAKAPLLGVVFGLMGIDPDAPPTEDDGKRKDAPSLTTADALAKLFKIATGWLGWSPADTYAATPLEITAAYEGRLDLLKAIFGDGGKNAPTIQTEEAKEAAVVDFFAGWARKVEGEAE